MYGTFLNLFCILQYFQVAPGKILPLGNKIKNSEIMGFRQSNIMKHLLIFIFLVVFAQPFLFSQTTWKSPDYKPAAIRSVMVLAQVEDRVAKQQLEDFTVKFLTDKGIKAVAAYSILKRTKFATKEDFLAYTDSLEVDGLLVYSVEDAEKVVVNQPTVSVGVGVGGMYGGYAGASAPIAGGAKMVTVVSMSGKFYTRSTTGDQWLINLSGKLDGPTDKLANSFAKTTAKAMLKDGLFISKK
jgi:hypothetical protein